MKIYKAGILAILTILGIVLVYGIANRHMLYLQLFALELGEVVLSEPYEEKAGVSWHDDYFTIEYIDAETIAIGEPRYWQANYNYLILGETHAVLFDSGPGVRDIAPVVNSLTDLPVTVVSSHLHFDHVGNHAKFDTIASIDLPHLRAMLEDSHIQLGEEQHLGFLEKIPAPALNISTWLKADDLLELGGRNLQLIHAPGHTTESIVLYDADRQQLFTGDYIYPGPLYAFLPNSDLQQYLATTSKLLKRVNPASVLLTAHRSTPPGAPLLYYSDLESLLVTLREINDGSAAGEGVFPVTYTVNDRVQLLTDITW